MNTQNPDSGLLSNEDLLAGELVRLVAEDPQKMADAFSRWSRDSEYWRLLAAEPSQPRSARLVKEWIEKELDKESHNIYLFMIHTLEDDRLIGEIGLDGIRWNHGDAFVGISIGERQYWSKGYGTDAMHVLLRYAFCELNLQRVSLTVFEYNQRAFRSYEKSGFTIEGRAREFLNRDGRRWDLIYMGILREEWQARNTHPEEKNDGCG